MNWRHPYVWLLLVFALVGVGPLPSGAEDFPTKPITIWVGFPAGGGTDVVARALAEGAEKILGQKIVVVNKPGAAATVATTELVKAKADGYTLVAATDTPVTRGPHLRDLDYDPFRDLRYIMRIGRFKVTWGVRADSPFKTWQDAVEWARKNPGQLIFGHPGIGTTPHLAMVRIASMEKFTYKSVPFAGDAPTMTALLGGHVTMSGTSSVSASAHVQAKKLRVLIVNEKEGLHYAPEATTFSRAGYDFEASTAVIIVAPRGVSDVVAARLEKAFRAAQKVEPFLTVAARSELTVGEPLTGTALMEQLRKASASYEELIKEAGAYKSERN